MLSFLSTRNRVTADKSQRYEKYLTLAPENIILVRYEYNSFYYFPIVNAINLDLGKILTFISADYKPRYDNKITFT